MNHIFEKEDQTLSAWSEAHFERLKKMDPAAAADFDASAANGDKGNGDGNAGISWPLERPSNGDRNTSSAFSPRAEAELRKRSLAVKENLLSSQDKVVAPLTVPMKEMLPGQKRSQAGIALRSAILGQVFIVSALLVAYYNSTDSRLWRPFFFTTCLSFYHFMEFYTHARFNLPNANISAFLLFDNGWPYLLAHLTALAETTLTSFYFPEWQDRFSPKPAGFPLVLWAGLALVFVGQSVRSMAIMKAGTNFNHQIQHKKAATHELVTDGIYGLLRHPSYFGFFWWAVGTQVVLGNAFCVCMYAFVLWRFFSRRIYNEERHLTAFFGKDYVFYKSYTKIGIPFIWSKNYPELQKPDWDANMRQNGSDVKSE